VGDALAAAALVVSLVALVVSALAFRRDRADIRIVELGAAAGQRYLKLVNVGRQPVRFVRVLERRTSRPWSDLVDVTYWTMGTDAPSAEGDDLDLVLQPAQTETLQMPSPTIRDGGTRPLYLQDAAGRRYRVVRELG
jgi:hypothetical protein